MGDEKSKENRNSKGSIKMDKLTSDQVLGVDRSPILGDIRSAINLQRPALVLGDVV